jgi:hypothetical protein
LVLVLRVLEGHRTFVEDLANIELKGSKKTPIHPELGGGILL